MQQRPKIKKSLTVLSFTLFSVFSTDYCYAEFVGGYYGGGLIFCVGETLDVTKCSTEKGATGAYLWVMANDDQANYNSPNHGVTWSNGDTLCRSYKAGEYTDWVVPTIYELYKMHEYAAKNDLIGQGCAGCEEGAIQCLIGSDWYKDKNELNAYWSSTEYPDCNNCMYSLYFYNKVATFFNKNKKVYLGVRAIRRVNKLFLGPNKIQPPPEKASDKKGEITQKVENDIEQPCKCCSIF